MSSLATRITVAVVGITAAVVLVSGVAMWLSLRAALQADADRELDGRAERVRRFDTFAASQNWKPRPPPPEGEGGGRHDRGEGRRPLQVVTPDGRELARSSALADGDSMLPATGAPLADGARFNVVHASGERSRVLVVAVKMPPMGVFVDPAILPKEGGVLALLSVSLVETDSELRRMAMTLAAVWLVATALAFGAGLALRRAVLRPLARLDCQLRKLRPEDLSARLPESAGTTEVRTLVGRLNTLLAGLEEAFKREQATIANIAHELRTPVAGLRTEIEFRLLAAADPGEMSTLRSLLATVGRMQAMVGNILMLARIEAGRERLNIDQADLVPQLSAAVERWEPRAMARDQEIELEMPDALALKTSAIHLDLVLDNLLGNAVAHGQSGAPIRIALTTTPSGAELVIRNTCGDGIDAARLGTAFYRADNARSDGSHCGLGLALCRRIAGLLGAQLDLSATGGIFTARLGMVAPPADHI
jgi:signal transduction histidine kinase